MPEIVTDTTLVTVLKSVERRISRLEQFGRTGAVQTSSDGLTGEGTPSTTVGAGLTEAAADARYLKLSGGTLTGGLTLNSSLTATSATFSGNVTINGTLTATGSGFARNDEVVHLAGAETITGTKTYNVEQIFHVGGTLVDPDAGVQRAIKVRSGGIAVAGGIKTDTLTALSANFTNGGVTTDTLTVNTQIVATGGIRTGTSGVLDLSPSNGVDLGTVGTGIGDKIALFSNTYGFGIQNARLVAFVSSASDGFAVRLANTTAGQQQSSGTDAHVFLGNGNATHTGFLTVNNGLSVTGGTVALPNRSIEGVAVKFDTITGVGSSSGTNVGNLAALTVGTDNLANGSVTNPKLSLAAVASNNVATGTLRDTDRTMFRTATAATQDERGQAVGGFSVSGGGWARATDGQAFDGVAFTTLGQTKVNNGFLFGPYYKGLKAGTYRATWFVKIGSLGTLPDQPVLGVAVNSTAGYLSPNNTYLNFTPNQISVTGQYVGISLSFTVLQDMAPSAGIETYLRYYTAAGTVEASWSHVTIEPEMIGQQSIVTTYFRDLAVTDAKIANLTVTKLTSGTINVDDIFLGTGGHIYAGISTHPGALTGRVELASGGLFGYDGTAQTFALTNSGLTLKGSILSGSTITGTVLTGTEALVAGSGVNVFKAGSPGIHLGAAAWADGPFRVNMQGALWATSANITGNINSGSVITGSDINATNTVSGKALVAGTVDADRLSVSVLRLEERVPNSNFELTTPLGTINWETTGTTTTTGRVQPPFAASDWQYQIAVAANSGNSLASEVMAVRGGETYEVGTAVRAANSNGTVFFRVQFGTTSTFTRATGVGGTTTFTSHPTGASDQAQYSDLASSVNVPQDTTVTFLGVVRAPANATHMRVITYIWTSPQAYTGYIAYISAKQRVGGTEIAGGTVTTQMVATTGLSADVITAGVLRAGSYIAVGQLAAGQSHTIIDARAGSRGIRLFNGTETVVSLDQETGSGYFKGEIRATSGHFTGSLTSDATITGGNFVGATFATSTGSNRTELNATGGDLRFYNGVNNPGILNGATQVGTLQGRLSITAPNSLSRPAADIVLLSANNNGGTENVSEIILGARKVKSTAELFGYSDMAVPLGRLALYKTIANSGAVTTEATLHTGTVNVPRPNSLIRVTFYARSVSATSGDVYTFRIKMDGVVVQEGNHAISVTGVGQNHVSIIGFVEAVSAGDHVFSVTMERAAAGAGSTGGTIQAQPTYPRFLCIEDAGV